LLIPIGVSVARKLIPDDVLADNRVEAARRFAEHPPRSLAGAAMVVLIWCVTLTLVGLAVRAW
jgi:hypothetical protein